MFHHAGKPQIPVSLSSSVLLLLTVRLWSRLSSRRRAATTGSAWSATRGSRCGGSMHRAPSPATSATSSRSLTCPDRTAPIRSRPHRRAPALRWRRRRIAAVGLIVGRGGWIGRSTWIPKRRKTMEAVERVFSFPECPSSAKCPLLVLYHSTPSPSSVPKISLSKTFNIFSIPLSVLAICHHELLILNFEFVPCFISSFY